MKITLQIDTRSYSELEELKKTVDLFLSAMAGSNPKIAMPTYLAADAKSQIATPDVEDDSSISFDTKVKLKEMICSVSGCFKRVKTKGVCQAHYMQEYNAKKKAGREVNK